MWLLEGEDPTGAGLQEQPSGPPGLLLWMGYPRGFGKALLCLSFPTSRTTFSLLLWAQLPWAAGGGPFATGFQNSSPNTAWTVEV